MCGAACVVPPRCGCPSVHGHNMPPCVILLCPDHRLCRPGTSWCSSSTLTKPRRPTQVRAWRRVCGRVVVVRTPWHSCQWLQLHTGTPTHCDSSPTAACGRGSAHADARLAPLPARPCSVHRSDHTPPHTTTPRCHTAEEFDQLKKAYAVLSDKSARAALDDYLECVCERLCVCVCECVCVCVCVCACVCVRAR
jgi:hypothetical protein